MCPSCFLVRLHETDVRQVAILLGVINPIADDELIRNLKTDIIRVECDESTGRLVEERTDFQLARLMERHVLT